MTELTVGQLANLACLLEVSAPKPGNVHRGADFHDASLNDFLASAVAIGPAFDQIASSGVGATVWQAVQATRQVTDTNTNLGLVLLLAPLAAAASNVPRGKLVQATVAAALSQLQPSDSAAIYRAIHWVQPSGLGKPNELDVNRHAAPDDVCQAMQLAADRDLVARQYATDYATLFDVALPHLASGLKQQSSLTKCIVHTHLLLMAEFPDTLIARKTNWQVAEQSAARAQRVLDVGNCDSEDFHRELADLDFWLRSDFNRRNPGATADLVGATLFVALFNNWLCPPYR